MVFVPSFSDTRTIKKIIPFEPVVHVVLGKILVRAMIHGAEIVLMYGESNKVWMSTKVLKICPMKS